MALDKKVYNYAGILFFIAYIFFMHSLTGWTLLVKYVLRNETTVESVTLDEDKMQMVGYGEPVINTKRYLHTFFVKSEDKYYLLGYDTCRKYAACRDKKCSQFIFQCRGDICLTNENIAKWELFFLLLALLSPLGASLYLKHYNPEEAS